MSAEEFIKKHTCNECGKLLLLEEMHYYENRDGTANCEECEGNWMEKVNAWRNGYIKDFPFRS